jgi:hypothetical protein
VLIKGVKYGNLDIVRHMVCQGANIHALNEALRWSAYYGHLEVVQQLFGRTRSRYSYTK